MKLITSTHAISDITWEELAHGKVILYFYPQDNTPGCTLESKEFSDRIKDFEKLGYRVYGVSMDSPQSHTHFIESCNLGVDLISDDGWLHEKFRIRGDKNLYGKIVSTLIRSTFLLEDGHIVKERRNIKATGHAQRVLHYLLQG